jgi:hypothetical protein
MKKNEYEYINNEELVRETIQAMHQENVIPVFVLVGITLAMSIHTKEIIWLITSVLLLLGIGYSSKPMIIRRRIHMYQRKYGTVQVKIKVKLSDKIEYEVNRDRMAFDYAHIRKVIETDHLIILVHPKELISIHKGSLKDVEETRKFIQERIIKKGSYDAGRYRKN